MWWKAEGRRLAGAMLVLWTLVLAGAVHARTPLTLSPGQPRVSLQDAGDAWLDTTGAVPLERVVADPAIPWVPTSDTAIYPLDLRRVLWIRFTLPRIPPGERWYLEIPYASVNKVTLHESDGQGGWTSQSAGDTLPVADWPVPHRHPLLPLSNSPDHGPRSYVLQVENSHSFSAPPQFVSESQLSRGEQRLSLILGMYFGLATLAVLLAIGGAITLQDSAFSLYALTVALMGLFQAALTGMGGLHLWPRWAWWNDVSPFVLPALAAASLQWFVVTVISLRQRSRRVYHLMMGSAVLGVLAAGAILAVDPSLRIQIMVPYIVLSAVLGISVVVWTALRGDRWAAWVLAGAVPITLGAAFPLARTAGLVAVSFWTTHGMQIGIAIELPVLLVMLMARSQHRREFARRIQGMGRIDPATGLLNASVFHERLVRLIARSQRLKIRSAMLLVDITNIDQIRRDFDRQAAQELALRVAGRLLSVARDIDSVARLSEHRFGLLLEGPLKADEVAEAGPRVIARCLMPFRNHPLEWTAKVQVAQALIPMDGTDADQLLGQLELLLAAAPDDERPSVRMLSRLPAAGALSPATS